MKIQTVIQKMYEAVMGANKTIGYHLLQQQRNILHKGLEAFAEVMDASLMEEKVGSMLPVRLWIKLKKIDGTFIYTHTQTLVSLNNIPQKGQLLRIKYLPENLSAILIIAIISNH